VAHGAHARLAASPYVFSRINEGDDDRVVVALDVPAGATIPLGAVFTEGQALRDAYTGTVYLAHGGAVTVAKASRAVLLERVR
jgi:alpha-amylase